MGVVLLLRTLLVNFPDKRYLRKNHRTFIRVYTPKLETGLLLLIENRKFLQIVCERSEVFASACALVRAFPQFSRKTNSTTSDSSSKARDKFSSDQVINVEFICTDGRSVTDEDVPCLTHVAKGIQMAARIVDTPCNEMHTDAFLDVCLYFLLLNLFSVLPSSFFSSSARLARTCPSSQ